ncbi:MAG: AraC family transcriptional regulator [Cyanobacteria bacterium P01_F01_bin.86]
MPEFENLELFRAEAIHYSYARHAHPSYAIGIIEAGVGGNSYQGNTYLAPPGSVVFMNPEEAHTGYSAEALPLTYRMLYPSIDLIQQVADELGLSEFPCFKDAVVKHESLFQRILNLHKVLEEAQSPLYQESLLIENLSAILSRYAEVRIPSMQLGQEHRAIHAIKEYLHDNFSSRISLTQLTNNTNLNRSYLIRVFRQAVGMPPYAYLTQIRVRQAKQLLQQGLSVAETAIAVGMADQSHLTRHFKQIFGVTPGYYRKMSTSFKTDPF